MYYTQHYLAELRAIVERLDVSMIERLVDLLVAVREREGRVFCLGIGGCASTAAHVVCDLRSLAGIQAYAPTDNVAELTAQISQHGWRWSLSNWLHESRLDQRDLVFVLTTDGGSLWQSASSHLVQALHYAERVGASVAAVLGPDGGYTDEVADVCVLIPATNPATLTPHVEELQCAICHLLVSHPRLHIAPLRWAAAGQASRRMDAETIGASRRAA